MFLRSPIIIGSLFAVCVFGNQELAAQPFRRLALQTGIAVNPTNPFVTGGMHPFWARFNMANQIPVGPFVRSTTGNYAFSTGAFNPTANGPYTLISRRGFFVPQNATFVPSNFGPYIMATREAFDPVRRTLVPSTTGPYLLASKGFLLPSGQQPQTPIQPVNPFGNFVTTSQPGTIVRAARGDFSPATGNFNPFAPGTSTLIARRGIFTPDPGTFTPSFFGPFTLRTRQAFDPKTNTLVPSATGPFVLSAKGDFNFNTPNSYAPFNFVGARMMAGFGHYNALLQNAYLSGQMSIGGGFNSSMPSYPVMAPYPYQASGYGGSGYGGSSSMYSPLNYQIPPVMNTSGSYGGSSYYGGNNRYNYGNYGGYYGSRYGAEQDDTYSGESPYLAPGAIPAYGAQTAKPKQENIPLAALGVPSEDGKVKWPLAFRLISPKHKEETLDKLEAQLKIVAAQVVSGNASPAVVKLARQNVANLHEQLRSRRDNLAEGTFHEANTFLRRVGEALQSITFSQSNNAPTNPYTPGNTTPSTTSPSTTVTVGAYDNYFQPANIQIAQGMQVRWVNNGRHIHTATAKDGSWDSGEIMPGAVFVMTFNQPGTHQYNCRHHSKGGGMRGTIVVGPAASDGGAPGY